MADACRPGRGGLVRLARRRPGCGQWLLVHGFLGDVAGWEAVARGLPAGDGVAAWALPGHRGGAARVPPDFPAVVAELAAAVRRLGGPAPWLVGYSLGGRLALGLRARAPTLCAGVAAIGAHPGLVARPAIRRRVQSDAAWARRWEQEPLASVLTAWAAQPLFAGQARAAPAAARRQQAWRRRLDGRLLAALLRATSLAAMPDLWPSLARPGAPLLLVAGADDRKFARLARAAHGRAAAAGRRSACVLLPGCGHSPLVEAPAALAAAILAWRPAEK